MATKEPVPEYQPELHPHEPVSRKLSPKDFPREIRFYRDPSKEPSWRVYAEFTGDLAQKLDDSDKKAVQNLVDSLQLTRRHDIQQRYYFVGAMSLVGFLGATFFARKRNPTPKALATGISGMFVAGMLSTGLAYFTYLPTERDNKIRDVWRASNSKTVQKLDEVRLARYGSNNDENS